MWHLPVSIEVKQNFPIISEILQWIGQQDILHFSSVFYLIITCLLKAYDTFITIFIGQTEVAKLQKHLSLLRQEYVKLQNKMLDMEQKLSLASAASGDLKQDSFISQLLKLVADLYDKEIFR